MKKRILSLILATVLICAMAIPASAAYSYGGTFNSATGSCTYNAYANCTITGWSALTEWTGSTDSYLNYIFQTDVTPTIYEGNVQRTLAIQLGTTNLRMGSNYSGQNYTMHSIRCEHYINGILVEGPCKAYPG